jgi:hypothetical protein
MRHFQLFLLVVLAGQVVWGDDPSPRMADVKSNPSPASNAGAALPRVLRQTEPADDVVVTLPGPPAKPVAAAPVVRAATIVVPAPPPPDLERPILRRPKSNLPDDFEKDSAAYLHERLGIWNEAAARGLLGEPTGSRPAYDDGKTVNGRIYAFSDPTGRYKQMELDFDGKSGHLRTVFVYPYTMTWQDCRRTFGMKVRATQANKGRIFYSYVDRRLDVLVDPGGKVISLGMY